MTGGKKFRVLLAALVLGGGAASVAMTPAARAEESGFAKIRQFSYNPETGTLVPGSSFVPPTNASALNAAAVGNQTIYGTDLQSSGFMAVRNYVTDQSGSPIGVFDGAFDGGLTVALGDVHSAPGAELIVGQATGGSLVKVRTPPLGSTTGSPISEFRAYEEGFVGGVRVAVGDVNGDGTNEIITAPGPGRAPTVKAFTPTGTLVASLDVFGSTFSGGVFVGAANVDQDATTEIVVGAGAGAGPHVRLLEGLASPLVDFFAFAPSETGGVRVALGEIGGVTSIVTTARTSSGPEAKLFSLGGELRAQTAIGDADGHLHPYIAEGTLRLADAAPRLQGASVTQVKDHTRGSFVIGGAGLAATFEDVTIGTEDQGAFVTYLAEVDGGIEVGYAIPAGAAGVLPIEVTVSTPGGTATHTLKLDTVSIATRAQPLRDFVTTGPGAGGAPHVRTFTDQGPVGNGFYAGADFGGAGARVARGDIDGDGVDEVIAATSAGPVGQIAVDGIDGSHKFTLVPYGHAYRSGIFVAVGDVLPDVPGAEIVSAADAGGGPHVAIYDKTGALRDEFFAYGEDFRGGVRVAVGDVDGDGLVDIVTSTGPGGAPHVQALSPVEGQIRSFYAYAEGFAGGVFVATADIDGDGVDEIVTAPGAGGGPHVRMFDTEGAVGPGFMAYGESFRGGVTVARVGDDILGPNLIAVGAGPGGGPHVQVFDPDGTSLDSFYAYGENFTGGVWVAGGIA